MRKASSKFISQLLKPKPNGVSTQIPKTHQDSLLHSLNSNSLLYLNMNCHSFCSQRTEITANWILLISLITASSFISSQRIHKLLSFFVCLPRSDFYSEFVTTFDFISSFTLKEQNNFLSSFSLCQGRILSSYSSANPFLGTKKLLRVCGFSEYSITQLTMSIAELKQACFAACSDQESVEAFLNLLECGFDKVNFAKAMREKRMDRAKIEAMCKASLRFLYDIVSISYNRSYGLSIARILHLLGRVTDIRFLDIIVDNLTEFLLLDDRSLLSDVHLELARVKLGTGMLDEADNHLRKGLELCGDKCTDDIGMANQKVADFCMSAKNFTDALVFYRKAEKIYEKLYMAWFLMKVRRNIAVALFHLGQNENALDESYLSLKYSRAVIHDKTLKLNKVEQLNLITAELLHADIQLRLGSLDMCVGAFDGYKEVVFLARSSGYEGYRVWAYIGRAFACFHKNLSEAEKYVDLALEIVETGKIESNSVFIYLEKMSIFYQIMGLFEKALTLATRLLDIHDVPEKFLLKLNQSEQEKHVELLEQILEGLKSKFGNDHFQVGYCYIRYGTLYLNFGKTDIAAKYLTHAKRVMDVCLTTSTYERGSVLLAHALSKTYAYIGRYDQAIECEQKVIEVLGFVPSHKDLLDEAVGLLNKYKQRASGKGPSSPSCSKR